MDGRVSFAIRLTCGIWKKFKLRPSQFSKQSSNADTYATGVVSQQMLTNTDFQLVPSHTGGKNKKITPSWLIGSWVLKVKRGEALTRCLKFLVLRGGAEPRRRGDDRRLFKRSEMWEFECHSRSRRSRR